MGTSKNRNLTPIGELRTGGAGVRQAMPTGMPALSEGLGIFGINDCGFGTVYSLIQGAVRCVRSGGNGLRQLNRSEVL